MRMADGRMGPDDVADDEAHDGVAAPPVPAPRFPGAETLISHRKEPCLAPCSSSVTLVGPGGI